MANITSTNNHSSMQTGAPAENQRISDRLAQTEERAIVSKTTVISGEISGQEDLRIEGTIGKAIHLAGVLVIGRECRFSGRIEAEHVIVEGDVEGQIKAAGKIEIRPGGHVKGRAICQQIAIAENAFLDGDVHTGKGEPLEPTLFTEKRKRTPPRDQSE